MSELFYQSRRHFTRYEIFARQGAAASKPNHVGILDKALAKQLVERVQLPFIIDTSSFKERVIIHLQLPDGVLMVTAPGERLLAIPRTYLFFGWWEHL